MSKLILNDGTEVPINACREENIDFEGPSQNCIQIYFPIDNDVSAQIYHLEEVFNDENISSVTIEEETAVSSYDLSTMFELVVSISSKPFMYAIFKKKI